ncbi:MAG: YigZ family protein [Campylobacterota bacterium]|nr:YigZ family protein [Campylobacterota bacterium]
MYFVNKEYNETLEIKKSKFITHICPYNDFNKLIDRLKQEHPKGRHFVYAYRYINEFDQIVENSSDDGEPKGTSGKPSLNVLNGSQLVNCGVIIVRYFGGIRLGTGGLVKAYSDAVNLVIKSAVLLEYVKLTNKSLMINYRQLSQIEYIIDKFQIKIVQKIFDTDVKLKLEGSKEEFAKLECELLRDCNLEDE